MTSPRRGLTSSHGTSTGGEHWATRGACNDYDPELWYTIGRDAAALRDKAKAKRICGGCPVLLKCRRHALDNRELYGIWGGYDEDERKGLARRQRRAAAPPAKATPKAKAKKRNPTQELRREADHARALRHRQAGTEPPCGTRAGYDHHRAIGEPYCGECRAHRATAAVAERGNRRPSQADTLVPEVLHLVSVGAGLHEAARATSKTVGALEKALQRAQRHDLLQQLRRTA